jgi:hypothetical protein
MIKKAEERIVQESTPVIQDISYDEIWDALIKTLSKSFVGRNDLLIKVKNKMVQVLSAFDLVVSLAGLEGGGKDIVLMKGT